MRALAIAFVALGAVSCGFDPPNGHLLCATSGKVCPDGMECVEAHCWRKGTAPADLSMQPTDDFAVPPKDNGEACSMDGECKSAACSLEHICCDKKCSGSCEACDTSGTCQNIMGSPASGHAECGGMSQCAGTCDGTKSDCYFPPSGTICGGACDGKCDGTGGCSASGGVCPGGYACGVGACKTSCTGNPDCQTNFHCNTGNSMCERNPETDCLDGIDNNGDGLIDCADPMCTAGFTCVPIPAAGTPLGVHITSGACPTNYAASMTAYHSGLTNGSCSGCTCQTYWNATVSGYGGNMTCSGSATKSYLHTGKDLDAFCDAPAGTFQSVGLTVFGANHCTTGGSVTYSGATWATNDTFCAARTSNTCGDATKICVAKPMGAAGVCDAVAAGSACPTGYANADPTTYYTNYSGGGCNACGCSNGSNVPVVIGAAYTGAGCSGSIKSVVGNGDCNPGASTAYASMRLSFNFGAIVDNCSTSATAKPVAGTNGATFCCQN